MKSFGEVWDMKFRIKYSGGEVVCTKDNLLRTAELQLKAGEEDVVKLISFLATSIEGSLINLNIGMLERLTDDKVRDVKCSKPAASSHIGDVPVPEENWYKQDLDHKLDQEGKAYSPSVPVRGRVDGYRCADKEFTQSTKGSKADPKDSSEKG